MSATARLGLLGALLMAPCATPASIVNIEGQRSLSDTEGFTGQFDLTLGGASGNTDKSHFHVGTRLQWQRAPVTRLVIAEYAYGESNNVRDTNRTFTHLRHIRQLRPQLATEAFLQMEQDEFTRLSFRGLTGGGLRLTLTNVDELRTHLGVGAFVVREVLDERPEVTDAGASHFVRGNLYLSLNWSLSGYATLYNTLYYQPAFDDIPDFRLLDEAGLIVQLSQQIDLKIAARIAHQSRPPQQVERTDINYTTGIVYRF